MPENRKSQHRLDPRSPLVVDTRELGRRPGSMREVRFPAPAPESLGVDLIGVPAGARLDLDLRLESVMEGVLVSGTATAPLAGECGRCLEPVSDTLAVELQELFAYPESDADDDEDLARMEGDLLDLEPVLRDAVVLALPLTPLCRQDCAGLCVECGERLDDLPADHAHDAPDPRWAALQGLTRTTYTQEK
ncbi:MAG: YceD family protein [Mycobacteriales bacterium]